MLKKNEKGFTLLEITIAMLVLTIGLLGIAGLQIVAIEGNATANHFTMASEVVADRIETFRNGAYDDIVSGTDYVLFLDKQPISMNTKPSDGFYMTRKVTMVNDTPIENTKTISVTVTWVDKTKQDGEKQERQVTYQTIIGKQ